MQTKRYLLILVCLGLCAPAAAAPITVPTSLNPGDEYRLAFVTSAGPTGCPRLLSPTTRFVTAVANTQAALASLGTTWKAIGSTATVDARDNTGTNPFVDGVGVPIFLLNDTLLANDNFDLWDGDILVPFEINETGAAVQLSFVWTGTTSSGVASTSLGSSEPGPTFGSTGLTGTQWVGSGNLFSVLAEPVYAVSDVLVVVPEPGTPSFSR